MNDGFKDGKRITIYDISRMSGFSPKTVSRVINGGKHVSKPTYNKIKELLDEHNFVPNTYAQNLSNKVDTNILLSVKKMSNFPLEWFYILLEQVIIECKKNHMNVIVEYFDDEDDIESSILYSSGSLIGATVIFYEREDDPRVKLLKKMNLPFLVFGKSETEGVKYVTNNDYESLLSLVNLLIVNKLDQLLIMTGGDSLVNQERINGATAAYKKNKLDLDLLTIKTNLNTIEDIYKYSLEEFSQLKNVPDVIFVSGDEKVSGLYRALDELDIKIPEMVSVVGFDNIPLSKYFSPPLTTISQNYKKLAEEIVKRLDILINQEIEIDSVEVPTQLIIRDSIKFNEDK